MPKMNGMAVAWMRQEDWPRWLAIDPKFQPDYDHWLKRMNAAMKDIEAKGTRCEKVEIDPDVFVEWCGVNRRKVEPNSRAEYAAQVLALRHDANH